MATAEMFRRTSCFVEWAKAQALIDGATLAMESGITPMWVEVDSKVVWNLLHDYD